MRIQYHGSGNHTAVRVVSPEGREMAALDADMLDQHIRAGHLSTALLLDRSPGAEQRLARLLVLLACAQTCAQGMSCLVRDCPRRYPAAPKTEADAAARLAG